MLRRSLALIHPPHAPAEMRMCDRITSYYYDGIAFSCGPHPSSVHSSIQQWSSRSKFAERDGWGIKCVKKVWLSQQGNQFSSASPACLPPAFPFPGRSWSRKVIIILAVPRAYSQPSRDISWDAELRNWVLQKSFAEIAE